MPRTSFKDEEFNSTSSEVCISGKRLDTLCTLSVEIGWRVFAEYKARLRREEAVNPAQKTEAAVKEFESKL
jgi:hypothetical protein